MTETLNEGMRAGDLEDLVLPMLTVDEFNSKVGDDAIVFGFYVNDRDAAMDLNRFIQKSPVKLLDTEISPAPDQRGFYLVFFEILLNDRMPEQVEELLKEVKPLVKIEKWKLQIRGQEDLIEFSREVIEKYQKHLEKEIEKKTEKKAEAKEKKPEPKEEKPEEKPQGEKKADKEPGNTKEEPIMERVLGFLTPSQLLNAEIRGKQLIVEGSGQKFVFDLVAFGLQTDVGSIVAESGVDLGLRNLAKEIRMSRMLGEGWSVTTVGDLRYIQHIDNEAMLLVRDRT